MSGTRRTHVYLAIRGDLDPECIRAGGISRIIRCARRCSTLGIHLHVMAPCFNERDAGQFDHEGVIWHRFFPREGTQNTEIVGQGLRLALHLMQQTPASEDEAHLLMPCNLGEGTCRPLQEAAEAGVASVLPLTMFPNLSPDVSTYERLRIWHERRFYRHITAAHVTSTVAARHLCRIAGKPGGWAKTIRTGVDLEQFRPAAAPREKMQLREELDLPPHKPIVLFVGGATHRKGVDFLLDVWERFAKSHRAAAHLVMVGGDANRPGVSPRDRASYEAFAREFARRLDTMQGGAHVTFRDHECEIEKYYRAADLFIFPSRHEGLPNTVLEAMASGLPVITSHFLGFPDEGAEFGFEGQHFIALDRDTGAWCDTIDWLLNDDEACARLAENARRWMESFQDIDSTAAKLAQFLHGVARVKLPGVSQEFRRLFP